MLDLMSRRGWSAILLQTRGYTIVYKADKLCGSIAREEEVRRRMSRGRDAIGDFHYNCNSVMNDTFLPDLCDLIKFSHTKPRYVGKEVGHSNRVAVLTISSCNRSI